MLKKYEKNVWAPCCAMVNCEAALCAAAIKACLHPQRPSKTFKDQLSSKRWEVQEEQQSQQLLLSKAGRASLFIRFLVLFFNSKLLEHLSLDHVILHLYLSDSWHLYLAKIEEFALFRTLTAVASYSNAYRISRAPRNCCRLLDGDPNLARAARDAGGWGVTNPWNPVGCFGLWNHQRRLEREPVRNYAKLQKPGMVKVSAWHFHYFHYFLLESTWHFLQVPSQIVRLAEASWKPNFGNLEVHAQWKTRNKTHTTQQNGLVPSLDH